MKRIFIMLLIACSAITTISADPTAATPQKKPEAVIAMLNDIIKRFGQASDQVYSVSRNPNTNQIEYSIKITKFVANVKRAPLTLNLASISSPFTKDEPLSYQTLHLTPGSTEMFALGVFVEQGEDKQYTLRDNPNQEMWLMCCKNPENPQLRDAYAIAWELNADQSQAIGTVYMITSLRPDVYMKNMSSAGLLSDNQNTFTIDGRVGYDLTDSLYVVYMADTAEELDKVADNDYVATMPVVNKRFSFSVQLDKPKVGRIRTVMPDGSLCELWTNLDFVPGRTYRITTHNGYYDEDRDYELSVGRYSGKSLLNDLQRRGIDDQTVVVVDEVPEEFRVVDPNSMDTWLNSLSPSNKNRFMMMAEMIKMKIERIKETYKVIGMTLNGNRDMYKIQTAFGDILKQNKELDKNYQDFIKEAKKTGLPSCEMPELYKEILKFYTEQNQGLSELYKDSITNGKPVLKLRSYLAKQTEKYLKDMEKNTID
jgi:hypothetical protein